MSIKVGEVVAVDPVSPQLLSKTIMDVPILITLEAAELQQLADAPHLFQSRSKITKIRNRVRVPLKLRMKLKRRRLRLPKQLLLKQKLQKQKLHHPKIKSQPLYKPIT